MEYEADRRRILAVIKYPLMILSAKEMWGDDAEVIVEEILQKGCLTMVQVQRMSGYVISWTVFYVQICQVVSEMFVAMWSRQSSDPYGLLHARIDITQLRRLIIRPFLHLPFNAIPRW